MPLSWSINAKLLSAKSILEQLFSSTLFVISSPSILYPLNMLQARDDIARLAAAFNVLFIPPLFLSFEFSSLLHSRLLFYSRLLHFVLSTVAMCEKKKEVRGVSSTKNLGFCERIVSLKLNLNAVRQFDYRRKEERRDQPHGSIIGTAVRVLAFFFFPRKREKKSRSWGNGKTNREVL